MSSHMDSSDVQSHGCRAIRNIALGAEFVDRIARSGGIACVVNAMQHHEDDETVQTRSIWTLRSLASESHLVKRQVADQGGIESIVIAMLKFRKSEDVQIQGCGALASLSANCVENEKAIVKAGGLDAVCTAMRMHVASEDVQAAGCTYDMDRKVS